MLICAGEEILIQTPLTACFYFYPHPPSRLAASQQDKDKFFGVSQVENNFIHPLMSSLESFLVEKKTEVFKWPKLEMIVVRSLPDKRKLQNQNIPFFFSLLLLPTALMVSNDINLVSFQDFVASAHLTRSRRRQRPPWKMNSTWRCFIFLSFLVLLAAALLFQLVFCLRHSNVLCHLKTIYPLSS